MNRDPLKFYAGLVARLRRTMRNDAAFHAAVGGDFVAMGKLECALLKSLGLGPADLVVDVGCGSGRLAYQLRHFPQLRYIGTDVVPELLEHASELCRRDDWTFSRTDGTKIPCDDGVADFVCFFSVLTHLPHEESFRYLREAYRVIRPGGRIVMSFLEFRVYSHWAVFEKSAGLEPERRHVNQFIGRDAIAAWAAHLGLEVMEWHDGDKPHIPIDEDLTMENGWRMTGLGCLGQSVAVLARRIA